jgi:hypothetical protein
MPGQQVSVPHFEAIGVGPGHIRLCCVRPVSRWQISAYVQGIEVGGCQLSRMFATGDPIDIPISYLPQVELPATMQFVEGEYDQIIAEPYVLSSVEPAMVLLGPGEFTVENLALDNGLLRGTLVNHVNGLAAPTMFARINRVVVRQVTVEQARPLDERGATRCFGVPVRIADLTETGLSLELFVVGVGAPVATFGYQRMEVSAIERGLIETEERIRQMQQSATLQLASVSGFSASLGAAAGAPGFICGICFLDIVRQSRGQKGQERFARPCCAC